MGKSSINGPFSMAMLNNQMVSPMAPQHPPAPGQTAWQSWPACDRPPDEILAAQLCEALHDLHDVFICTEKGAKIAIYSGFIVETWWKILENDVKNGGTSWKIMETWWKHDGKSWIYPLKMMISWDFGMGFIGLPSGYDIHSSPRYRWPIETDGPYRS